MPTALEHFHFQQLPILIHLLIEMVLIKGILKILSGLRKISVQLVGDGVVIGRDRIFSKRRALVNCLDVRHIII